MLVSNGVSINTIPEIANTLAETFAKTSSCDNYTPAFQALKRREERGKLNFSSSNEEGYNSPLTLLELRVALHRSGNTAAGPDVLHYIMLRHLSESSILSLLLLFNRIWETQNFPTQWCHAHVLPFPKPEKTISVVFSRKRGVFPNPELFIGRSLIKVVKEFKFLGLIFDQSLRFHRHLKDLKIRSAKALNILKVLANTHWGAYRTSLLRIYRALIRSKLDYGSVVYSSACKSLLKILDPVHHQGLRLCLGAFRTSPLGSLYAEAYEPLLDLRRKYLCLNHFMKIQSMKTNTAYSYLFNFSLYDFNSHRSPLTYSQPFHFRIRDLINDLNLNIGRTALCKISEVPQWKVIYSKVDFILSCYSKACTPVSTYRTLYLERRELFSDYEPIFTDGSKSESHVGSAVVSLSTTYTALQSIVSLHSSSHPILVDITYALANHLKKKDIRFCWIPGHAGITGNELADTAARSATGSSERFPIPHFDLKACFRQKLQSVWQSNWDQQTENKLHSVMPVLAPTVPSSSNHREQVIWTRLNLGHTRLTHSHLLFGEPPPYCEVCNVSLSVKHILCDCPHSNHLRHRLFNSVDFTISSILNNSTNSSLVFKFISIKGFIHHI
ncbi:putative RNA-directed DNA polymerase from transposon X-element [Trichonephila clavata]|uniref:Putative RNA-directed DNA polymerase from transposon X-element n=1 Tax=Trichonephila clavata TaxID=2740835 RepID=A0A8X6ITJ9_TRICU|nr:putative RNA-directed DNA polymerase from transposon X-element [Trichonephila clavata]